MICFISETETATYPNTTIESNAWWLQKAKQQRQSQVNIQDQVNRQNTQNLLWWAAGRTLACSLPTNVLPTFCELDHVASIESAESKLMIEMEASSIVDPALVHGASHLCCVYYQMLHITPTQVWAENINANRYWNGDRTRFHPQNDALHPPCAGTLIAARDSAVSRSIIIIMSDEDILKDARLCVSSCSVTLSNE